jgi:hypothetical protein
MNDRYTKFVLTIIAAALSTIAVQQLLRTASAENTTLTCGETRPCMVQNVYWDGNSQKWTPCSETRRGCYNVGALQVP